jgi:hypothetical protein
LIACGSIGGISSGLCWKTLLGERDMPPIADDVELDTLE